MPYLTPQTRAYHHRHHHHHHYQCARAPLNRCPAVPSRHNLSLHIDLLQLLLLLLVLLLLLSTFIERTFAGCHKCTEDNSYTLNNNVFSLFLNVVRVMSGDLSSMCRADSA